MTDHSEVATALAAALSAAESVPRTLAALRAETREGLDVVGHTVTRLEARLDELSEDAQAVHGVLRDMSVAYQTLSDEHYARHVIDPIARVLMPLVDMTYVVKTDETEFIEGVRAQLLEALAHFGILPICPRAGAEFERASMKPGGTVRTSKRDEDETVASVSRLGFRRDTHVLRAATVTLRRFDATVPAHLTERRTT